MLVAGIDECGTGALVGSIVACCVVIDMPKIEKLDTFCPLAGVNDSKKLTVAKRRLVAQQLVDFLVENRCGVGIGEGTVEEINRDGHSVAWSRAMRRAYLGAVDHDPLPDVILVDGSEDPRLGAGLRVQMHVKGDATFFPVAAASILGKVWRDGVMDQLLRTGHEWAASSGYASKENIRWVFENGPTEYHRVKASRSAADTFRRAQQADGSIH